MNSVEHVDSQFATKTSRPHAIAKVSVARDAMTKLRMNKRDDLQNGRNKLILQDNAVHNIWWNR